MNKITFYILLVPFLFSCQTSYYYAQLESADPYMQKNEKGNFVFDSDSILISYSFSGENAPVKVNVVNKMKTTIYVDWNESYFDFGDTTAHSISMGAYMGNEYKNISTIEPGFSKRKEIFELSGLKFEKMKKREFNPEDITLANGKQRRLDVARFSEDNSPLFMKSSLSIRVGSAISDPIIYDQYFYIEKIINGGGLPPDKISLSSQRRGDTFYTRKERGKGLKSVLNVGGQVLLVAGVVAVEVLLTSDND